LGWSQPGKGSLGKKNRIVLHAVKFPGLSLPMQQHRRNSTARRKTQARLYIPNVLMVSVGATERCLFSHHLLKLSRQPRCDATCLLQRIQTGNSPSLKMFKL